MIPRLQMSVYNELDRPSSYTPTKMMREIELSYRLIFGEHHKSRKLYRSQEARKASISGAADSTLDSLCGLPQAEIDNNTWLQLPPQVHSFDKTQSFPFLLKRLDELQEYMLRQQPRGLVDMFIDRRDKFRWHTFWAVIIIGGLGLLLGIIQTVLASLQVVIGYKSLSQSRSDPP